MRTLLALPGTVHTHYLQLERTHEVFTRSEEPFSYYAHVRRHGSRAAGHAGFSFKHTYNTCCKHPPPKIRAPGSVFYQLRADQDEDVFLASEQSSVTSTMPSVSILHNEPSKTWYDGLGILNRTQTQTERKNKIHSYLL